MNSARTLCRTDLVITLRRRSCGVHSRLPRLGLGRAAGNHRRTGRRGPALTLLHKHINILGRYEFNLPDEVARGQLRPLRGLETLDDFLAQLPRAFAIMAE